MNFSKWLFWDVDQQNLDVDDNQIFIIHRVLQRGDLTDWKRMKELYGDDKILSISKKLRDLDDKTVNLLSVHFNVPKEEFECYKNRQSMRKHWEF